MNAWLHNTLVEIKLTFRDKEALFWNYILPLLFLFLFCSIFGRGNPKGVTGMMPGLLCISAMAAGFFNLSIGLVTARERSILRRYQLAPVRPWLIITSQLTANFIIVISTLMLQLAAARLVYHIEIAGSIWSTMLLLITGVLAFLALGFVIASVAESVKVALVTANILFYPLMFLGGAAIPKQMLSPALRKVALLLPTTFFVDGLGQIMVDGASLRNSLPHLIVLLSTFVVALAIAAKLFRWDSNTPHTLVQRAWIGVIALIFVFAAIWI